MYIGMLALCFSIETMEEIISAGCKNDLGKAKGHSCGDSSLLLLIQFLLSTIDCKSLTGLHLSIKTMLSSLYGCKWDFLWGGSWNVNLLTTILLSSTAAILLYFLSWSPVSKAGLELDM